MPSALLEDYLYLCTRRSDARLLLLTDAASECKASWLALPSRKEDFHFISMIRLPDFVTKEDFDWAVETATKKKKKDFSKVEFFHYEESRCVQCMHIGSYDMEPVTIGKMKALAAQEGLSIEIDGTRMHHEIYLSDPRKTSADKLKTVIRYPVK